MNVNYEKKMTTNRILGFGKYIRICRPIPYAEFEATITFFHIYNFVALLDFINLKVKTY
jgi:hypothetical protein